MSDLVPNTPKARSVEVISGPGAKKLRRVRFEVALDSAEKSKLKPGSRLLAVTVKVQAGTP